MKDWLTWKGIALALPVVLGPLTYLVMAWLKVLATVIDRSPAVVQRAAVVVIAVCIAAAAEWTGVKLECVGQEPGCTLADVDVPLVKAVLGSVVAMVMHAMRQAPPRGP